MAKPYVLVGLPLLIVAGLIGWRIKLNASEEGDVKKGANAPRTSVVQVMEAGPTTISSKMLAGGQLESPFRTNLSPRESGKIEVLDVREGDEVSAGQVVIQMNDAQAQAQVQQAQANLVETQARYAQAKLQSGPNSSGIQGDIDQQTTAVQSANSSLNQVKSEGQASITTSQAAESEAAARVVSAGSAVDNAEAGVEREKSVLKSTIAKLDRAKELHQKGYISDRELEDADTANEIQKKTLRIAETNLQNMQSALKTANTQHANAKSQVELARKRATSNTQVAEARVRDAQSALKVAKANRAQNPAYKENLRALEASIRVAQAGLAQAQVDLGDTKVRSKIAGVITSRTADPGALAGPGSPILVVESLDWLYFSASVPVENSGKLRVGQQASIIVEGLGKPVQGQISHINPSANIQSRQVQVKIRIENPAKQLRPGMIGKMELQLDAKKVEVAVPKEALQYKGKIVQVGVVNAESKIEVRDVELGFTDDTTAEIKSGLKAGEKVITLISEPLREGKEVKIAGAKGESR